MHHSLTQREAASLVHVVAATLSRAETELQGLQTILGEVLAVVPELPAGWTRLQGLDRMTQTLSALSTITAALGAALPPACLVAVEDVIARVPLDDLRRALSGNPPAEPDIDDAELF